MSSNSSSKPHHRPFPNVREIRTEPHESEPAYSYEDNSDASFLNEYYQEEDDFHNRLQKSRRESHGHGHGHHHHSTTNSSSSNNLQSSTNSRDSNASNSNNAGGGSSGTSFWRTNNSNSKNKKSDASSSADQSLPAFNSVSLMRKGSSTAAAVSSDSSHSYNQNRKQSGLSALLAQHQQHDERAFAGDRLSDLASSPPPTKPTRHHAPQKQQQKQQPPPRNSSFNSSGGLSARDANKKKDRQRKEDRRLKTDYLENEVDQGHIIVNQGGGGTGRTGGDQDDVYVHTPSSSSRHHVRYYNSNGTDGSSSTTSSSNYNHHKQVIMPSGGFGELNPRSSTGGGSLLDRSSSDQSTGSLLYGKTPNSAALLGKSGSLIFPTGVEGHTTGAGTGTPGGGGPGSETGTVTTGATGGGGGGGGYYHDNEADSQKRRKINLLLDQCETVRFPFKKKLILSDMQLTAHDIPLNYLCGTPLGNSLHKLSLAANRLGSIPERLVQSLPNLKHLDLSKCELHQIPHEWHLPQLKRLNLSHNRLRDFPEEGVLEGLPELQDLNLYGNKIAEIIVPNDPSLLSKIDVLNMGYNDLAYLPDDLDQFKSLKTLKVMNNFLEKIPMRICDMDLRSIDVSANPVTQPPIETCERGICSMKRYYHCLRLEEQSKQKALEEVQRRVQRTQRKNSSGTATSASSSTKDHHHHHATKPSTTPKKKYGAFFNQINPLGLAAKVTAPATSSSSVARKALAFDESPSTGHFSSLSTGPATPGQAPPSVKGGASVSTAAALSESASSLPAVLSPSKPAAAATKPAAAQRAVTEPGLPQQQQRPRAATVATPPTTPLVPKDEVLQPHKEAEDAHPSTMPTEAMVKPALRTESSEESNMSTTEATTGATTQQDASAAGPVTPHDEVTVNETLKVIFVGMAMVGKTSMIKRLIKGRDAIVPKHDERTVGVDIYEWDPKKDKRFEHIDSRIEIQDQELLQQCGGDKHVMFSVWDFAGQHVYHATHELFFSPRALYVLVWDMGATNRATLRQKASTSEDTGPFKLTYDSESEDGDSDHEDNIFAAEEEARRADRALERDIDEKVQFWVDCIQSSAPGAAILPVASFADYFANDGGEAEAIRRCNILKQRLLKHEDRRIKGIKERLQEYYDQNRPDDPAAVRLRKLLCSFTRPKLIFGDDQENSVVRVSGTEYTGFDKLTEKIMGIATGRDKGQWRWPIFHGQVGARIPRMRLEVRDVVRQMRIRFKVVEWGYFISQLRERGLTSVEDISDALHFLTNTGELSYFGGVMTDNERVANPLREVSSAASPDIPAPRSTSEKQEMEGVANGIEAPTPEEPEDEDDMDMDYDEDQAVLSMDDTKITAPSTEDGSLTTVEDYMSSGLSQFVFLNPRWLVEAVACILRHDLDREIQETRRMLAAGRTHSLDRTSSFSDAQLNCPVITAENACMLWQAKRITKKAAERAQEHSNNMAVTPFEFLQLLLIRFGVFVPIDLSIEKAFLGGKEYSKPLESIEAGVSVRESTDADQPTQEITVLPSPEETALKAKFFFLPSLLGPGEPSEAWTYKNAEGWKTTLCHSILFPDGVPPGLMERLTASVLSSIYAVANRKHVAYNQDSLGQDVATYEGRLTVREVLCWRTAFLLKLGTLIPSSDGTSRESIVEIFALLADRESHLCVGSDYMGVGTRRLIVSGRGQVGDGGKKIWKGGYLLVTKCIRRVMDAYGGLEYEKQAFCPECLAKKSVSECSSWEFTQIRSAVANGQQMLRCRQHGHQVDTRLLAGPLAPQRDPQKRKDEPVPDPIVPVKDLLGAVVLVGLWDGKTRKIKRAGSGVIVDRKRGLIVTASHTLMDIWGDQNYPFGENYYGMRQGKVVIGVIPRDSDSDASGKHMAVFRYFAKIVVKDPSLEDKDECHLDACVLRITTRMENDVGGNGEGCADQPEILLLNNEVAVKSEKLPALRIQEKVELEEQVRILGFNQGGEGLLGPGESLNRYFDFARGYVCMKFSSANLSSTGAGSTLRDRFKPSEEVAVICQTIGGHSGGPCVNQQGEVVGILSRADPAESQRCYISPASAWKDLVKKAKKII